MPTRPVRAGVHNFSTLPRASPLLSLPTSPSSPPASAYLARQPSPLFCSAQPTPLRASIPGPGWEGGGGEVPSVTTVTFAAATPLSTASRRSAFTTFPGHPPCSIHDLALPPTACLPPETSRSTLPCAMRCRRPCDRCDSDIRPSQCDTTGNHQCRLHRGSAGARHDACNGHTVSPKAQNVIHSHRPGDACRPIRHLHLRVP
ncbi:hypothetical protein M433DRAFT_426904 [Acidomyces richmondensis BFW]|nr:hypothetical protein M433DRAFT_426904 [Acidomyces richmondensis BFW]